jgi:general secretion pathway protein G
MPITTEGSHKPPIASEHSGLKMNRRVRLTSVAVILIAILCGGLFYLMYPPRRAREAMLKQDLRAMREAIDNYTIDKRQAAQTLRDLVTGHYLRIIPTDPFTGKEDWRLHFGDSALSSEVTVNGIDDVHSASALVSRAGIPYSLW